MNLFNQSFNRHQLDQYSQEEPSFRTMDKNDKLNGLQQNFKHRVTQRKTKSKSPIELKLYQRSISIRQLNQKKQDMIDQKIKDDQESKKLSQNSQKILTQKLENNLGTLLQNIDPNNVQQITFEQLGRILYLVGIFRIIEYDEQFIIQNKDKFYSTNATEKKRINDEMIMHEQIWIMLSNNADDTYIQIEKIYTLLRVLLDPNQIKASKLAKVLKQFLNVNQQQNSDIIIWSIDEFVIKYRKLIQDKFTYLQIQNFKDKKAQEYQLRELIDNSHHPVIQDQSKKLDQINQQKYLQDESSDQTFIINASKSQKLDDRINLIYLKDQKNQEKLQKQRDLKDLEEQKELTFHPKINKDKYSNMISDQSFVERNYTIEPYLRKEEAKQLAIEQKQQKEMLECTFSPKINSEITSKQSSFTQNANPQGYDEAINRLRYAQDKYQKKKQALDHIPIGENYYKLKNNKNLQPFSFVNNDRQFGKGQSILQIEVKLGGGKTGKISIYKGDQPQQVAQEFAKMYSLSKQKELNLLQIIQQQMENL